MSSTMTRRQIVQVAGGFSFLAIMPDGRADTGRPPLSAIQPVFKALPYLQPGSSGSTLREGDESIVLAWETTRVPTRFEVDLGRGGQWSTPLTPERTERYNIKKSDGASAYHYAVTLNHLQLSTRYEYRVRMDGKKIVEGWFTTRRRRNEKTRFVAFGDNSLGDIHERMIAYQAYQARPDFIVNTGDNVYESGLGNEYTRYFFPIYNAEEAHPRLGAPLLRSFLFYTVLGNHDFNASDDKGAFNNFSEDPDCLGYFQCLHLPLNGLERPPHPIPIRGDQKQIDVFQNAAGERYPRMANYSFDYGAGHFLCLDSNTTIDPTQPALQAWIEKDLSQTDAVWKFVSFHHPCFNAGKNHYSQQHMRVLAPIFEKHGVAVVFHGHEHTYQRTRPLRFAPKDVSKASLIGSSARLVPGQFTVDTRFDGRNNSRPEGILYITTGAAGKYLYDAEMHETPARWTHVEDNHQEYVARFVCDRFSFTVVDMSSRRLTIRQVDQWGQEIDRCLITQ